MPILTDSSREDVKRLLELFPVANLRQAWPDARGRTKEEVCTRVADQNDSARIAAFIHDHISCCKQHVYIFGLPAHAGALPATVPEGELVHTTANNALYIIRVTYSVVLRDPLEEDTLDFLWPVAVETRPPHLIVKFVVLEKNLDSYFDRPAYISGRNVGEDEVLAAVLQPVGQVQQTDLHKGIKALWANGFMDSPQAKYKTALSTASQVMDGALGIREHNPDLYAEVLESPLFKTVFFVASNQGSAIASFAVDPIHGQIGFSRYCEVRGDSDRVIHRILDANV